MRGQTVRGLEEGQMSEGWRRVRCRRVGGGSDVGELEEGQMSEGWRKVRCRRVGGGSDVGGLEEGQMSESWRKRGILKHAQRAPVLKRVLV